MLCVLLDQRVEQCVRAASLEIEVRAQQALSTEACALEDPYRSLVVRLDECFQADDGGQAQRPTAQQADAPASKASLAAARHRPVADTNDTWLLPVEQTHEPDRGVSSFLCHRKNEHLARSLAVPKPLQERETGVLTAW